MFRPPGFEAPVTMLGGMQVLENPRRKCEKNLER
jgi:hypothetical protein